MIRFVIVDDEPLAIDIIETYMQQIKEARLAAKFTDPVEAFSYLQRNPVELVFLDLTMPVLNGLELLKNLSQRPAIIVTTAYRDFAVESFELDVVDYLVKPISFARFLKAVNKAVTNQIMPESAGESTIGKTEDEKLWLKVDKKMVAIPPNDILYLQSLKDYVRVVTADQKLVIYHTLQALLNKLPAEGFVRIHKSYVVQVAKINAIEGNAARVRNEQIPIGRNYRKALQEVLKVK